MVELSEIEKKFKEDKIKLVELQFTDIFGRVKSTTVTSSKFLKVALEGMHFDGSSVKGFARLQESDQILKPDLNTYSILPWKLSSDNNEARFICDVFNPDGSAFEGDSRFILKKVLLKARELGFKYFVGTEQEFVLINKDEIDGLKFLNKEYRNDHYFDFIQDTASSVRRDMILALEQMGMIVEMSHQEVASDQHEINIKYSEALHHADDAITFRYALKQVARQHNKFVSFMPKTINGVNGSGMHTHQSLSDLNGKNLFFDESNEYCLSELAYNFMSGQLNHIKAITAITNPTINSYKRLTPGFEAACYISWARMNRSALIRIPAINKNNPNSVRLELRSPDPSCNPYLSFAVLLAAGLDGIKNKLKPIEPREENIFELDETQMREKNIDSLPASLIESLNYFKENKLMRETLGEQTFEYYLQGKLQEWNEFRLHVTDWEYKKYLKIL